MLKDLDWLAKAEWSFVIMIVEDEQEVSAATYKWNRNAAAWWHNVVNDHYCKWLQPIQDWLVMEQMIEKRFLLSNHPQFLRYWSNHLQFLYNWHYGCLQENHKGSILDFKNSSPTKLNLDLEQLKYEDSVTISDSPQVKVGANSIFQEIESYSGENKSYIYFCYILWGDNQRITYWQCKYVSTCVVMMKFKIENPNMLLKLTNEVDDVLSVSSPFKKLVEKFHMLVM